MEDNQVNCSIESIEKYYNDFEQLLESRIIPSAFIFNIDEVGFAEWSDSAHISVVVPADAKEDEIKVPIDCQGKQASFLAGISANSDTLTPAITVPRKTIETELFENGYPDNYMDYKGNIYKKNKNMIRPLNRCLKKKDTSNISVICSYSIIKIIKIS